MTDLMSLTTAQLKRAIAIKNQIDKLESQLASIVGSPSAATPQMRTRRPMSAAAKAKIAAAQRRRWAKVNGKVKPAAKAPAKKRVLSAAAKAKIAAAAKARWAKAKAAGKKTL